MNIFERVSNWLDRPIPSWKEIRRKREIKRNPVKYVTRQYVKTFDEGLKNHETFLSASNTLKNLAEAEKNYSANDPRPGIAKTVLKGLLSLAGIGMIINAERSDSFPTKAWPFVPRIGDKDD